MSDPARLLSGESGEADDFEKRLLGSWEAEQPSDAARARVLTMAGLGVAAGTGAVAGKVGAAAGGSLVPKAGAAGAVAIAKWVVVGAIGIATAGVTYQYSKRAGRVEAPPVATPVPAVVAAVAVPTAAHASPPPADVVGPRADDTAVVTPVALEPSARASSPRRPGGARTNDPALGEQVSSLDRARRALGDGDAAAALRQLDDFEARFPHGALVEEAEVLRVQSLLAAGDHTGATRAAGRFLAAHPDSPHAARVRALLGQAPGP